MWSLFISMNYTYVLEKGGHSMGSECLEWDETHLSK